MKISEILKQNKPTVSFEVFPPKTESALESIRAATEEIASLSPAFMSVTYGAGGGTSKYTIDIAKNIEDRYGVPTLAHLTCVSSTRETVRERIDDMRAAGIKNVMALRGDIPRDRDDYPRDYKYAYQLVEELSASGEFCIGGACYPEGHPESASAESDIIHLRHKVESGLDFLTTQMFFDNSLYYSFLDKAKNAGIDLPIIPGIMPITALSQIDRVVALSGSYLPREFLSMVEKYGADPISMKQAGIAYTTEQILDLFKRGVKNVHVYSMNKPEVARAILNNLSGVIEK
ncbi:MAG: methylenetetrahydrofolate reductase [NAD(P)H] [Clostridia bacterium]|nr:methylenetetrahydrofolate reductase [NAD(P)H] [Clostridia bacterium]